MASRTRVKSDKELMIARKTGKHNRSERIDNAFTYLMILGLWTIGLTVFASIIYSIYLYTYALSNPDSLDIKTKETMETIFSYGIAVVAGYIAHLAKRNLEV